MLHFNEYLLHFSNFFFFHYFSALNPPNPKCYVCASKPEVVLKIATDLVTVKELRDDVLIKALNMVDPDVILDGRGLIVISSEEIIL